LTFQTALTLLRKKALDSMKDLSPSIWPHEWDRLIQTYGACLECGAVDALRKDHGSWSCYRCNKAFTPEVIYHAYPFTDEFKEE